MQTLRWQLRIFVLWITMLVAMLGLAILAMLEPGFQPAFWFAKLSGAAGLTHAEMLVGAFFMLGPLVMAFLSVTLSGQLNRTTNLALAIIYTAFNVASIVVNLEQPSAPQLLIGIATLAASALVIWHAQCWPKGEESAAEE